MITTQTLSNIRSCAFGLGGAICAVYAVMVVVVPEPANLPHLLPPLSGIAVALIYFLAAFLAGPEQVTAALDEGYQHDGRIAASAGFWAALTTGTALWLTGAGGDLQLAVTMTTAAATYMLVHVWRDLCGRRCA